MSDKETIYRQDAIDAIFELYEYQSDIDPTEAADLVRQGIYLAGKKIEQLPSAQQEIKPIGYNDCSNAMMKMWMDNVVTDGEYNRIMDKLNAYWRSKDE